jgi:hypothetical protein
VRARALSRGAGGINSEGRWRTPPTPSAFEVAPAAPVLAGGLSRAAGAHRGVRGPGAGLWRSRRALAAYEKQWLLTGCGPRTRLAGRRRSRPNRVVSEQLKNHLLEGARAWRSWRDHRRRARLVFASALPAQTALPRWTAAATPRAWACSLHVPDPARRRQPGPRGGRAAVPAGDADFIEFVAVDTELRGAWRATSGGWWQSSRGSPAWPG